MSNGSPLCAPRHQENNSFVLFALPWLFFVVLVVAINVLFLPMVQVGCYYICLMKWEFCVGGSSDGHH